MGEAVGNVGLARLIFLCGSDPVMRLLALKRSLEVDCSQNVGDELPFLGFNFENGAVSDIVAKRASKHPEVGGEIVLDVPGSELAWLKVTSYAFFESCKLERIRLNGVIDDEEARSDDYVPDTDSLGLLSQQDAHWTQDTSAVNPSVASEGSGNLEAEWTPA